MADEKIETREAYRVHTGFCGQVMFVSGAVEVGPTTVRQVSGNPKLVVARISSAYGSFEFSPPLGQTIPLETVDFSPEAAVLRFQAETAAKITKLREEADELEARAHEAGRLLEDQG